MSVEQHQQTLLGCYQNTSDPKMQSMAEQANSYTELLKTNQISRDEYVELMEDIKRQANINQSVEHQQLLIHMNTAINGLISLAKLV
jgi:hypothetical protein